MVIKICANIDIFLLCNHYHAKNKMISSADNSDLIDFCG